MRKMVILTEGQTEQIFIAELILHVASTARLKIDSKRLWGGRKFETYEIEISTRVNTDEEPDYYILILDCTSDGRVVSALKERYAGFIAQSFEEIVLVRDVRPEFEFDEISDALVGFARQLPSSPVRPVIVLATMEVETWFIRELSHFAKIDASLTPEKLKQFGIEEEMDFERIEEPADKMKEIYEAVGSSYGKSRLEVENTVRCLDKPLYFTNFTDKIPSVKPVIEVTKNFFDNSNRNQQAEGAIN